MKRMTFFLLAVLCLAACDDNLKVISRDFSVSLQSVEGNTAVAGKAVKCIFTVNGLDADNDDPLFTTFSIRNGKGKVMIESDEYEPGETFEYDYKQEGTRLSFDFVPEAAGTQVLTVSLASDLIVRSDSITLKVKPQEP